MNLKHSCKILLVTVCLIFFGCGLMQEKRGIEIDQFSYDLGVVGGFSELVNAGVKRLALSPPLSREEMDIFIVEAEKTAAEHNVSIYRESDLIVTDLFPSTIAQDKDVLLLYAGTTLQEYLSPPYSSRTSD